MVIDDERVRREKLTETIERLVEENQSNSFHAAERYLEEAQRYDSFFLQNVEQAVRYLKMAETKYAGDSVAEKLKNVLGAYGRLVDLKLEKDLSIDYEQKRIKKLRKRLNPGFFSKVGYYLTFGLVGRKRPESKRVASSLFLLFL